MSPKELIKVHEEAEVGLIAKSYYLTSCTFTGTSGVWWLLHCQWQREAHSNADYDKKELR